MNYIKEQCEKTEKKTLNNVKLEFKKTVEELKLLPLSVAEAESLIY